MKAGLSLILTLIFAAGPWLCCCTAGRANASEVATPVKPSCCAPQQTADDSPLTPAHRCHCQGEREPLSVTAADQPGIVLVLGLDGVADAASWVSVVADSLVLAPDQPLPASHDILLVCHILRC